MDDVIAKYNKTAEEYAKSRIGAEDKAELAKFKSMLKPGYAVLDVGCAAGRDTRILKGMGFNAVGVDLAEKLIEIARVENPDLKFVLGDMRKLPFDDESYQAVWASAVLHHVGKSEMPAVLHEFWRVLAPGGLLYVHTKAGKGEMQTQEANVHGENREFELMTAEGLDALLTKNDFQKRALEQKQSKSRKGLFWANAFYVKREAPAY